MIKGLLLSSKILVLLLLSLMLFGTLSMAHTSMNMNHDGGMTDCPFMPGVTICSMSPFEVISASQSFLSDIALQKDIALLLLLISGAFVSYALFKFFSPPRDLHAFRIISKHSKQTNFLLEAFSSGLLNPKLF